MKELNNFLSEKTEAKKGAQPTKKGHGSDDKQYVALMAEYKKLRRNDKEGASKVMEKIMKLKKDGDVSEDAKIAGAYI